MIALAALIAVQAQFEVNRLFSDHAVLQRGNAIPIFGTGQPGATVDIDFAGRAVTAEVDTKGNWIARLRNVPEGGPYTLEVNGEPVARDVLVGEVWFASGQSNMSLSVARSGSFSLARARAGKQIRFFKIPEVSARSPLTNTTGSWIVTNADNVGPLSGTAFWFATNLLSEIRCPIGIIQATWANTKIESWLSLERLEEISSTKDRAKQTRDALNLTPADLTSKYQSQIQAAAASRPDPGISADAKDFETVGYGDGGWSQRRLPNSFEQLLSRTFDGAIWFRREFELQDGGGAGTLRLGTVGNSLRVWVNGKELNPVSAESGSPSASGTFDVPTGLLRFGKNVVAMRVFNFAGPGGFFGDPDNFRLGVAGGKEVNLAGSWRYRIDAELPPSNEFDFRPPGEKDALAGAYNGMVAPSARYGIRGFLFYQDEENAGPADEYRQLFSGLIGDWRTEWRDADLLFFWVQVAGYGEQSTVPRDSDLARFREMQEGLLSTSRTGMASAIDLSDEGDLNPKLKLDVGYRLSLLALAKAYRKTQGSSGPVFDGVRSAGNTLVVRFRSAEGLRTSDGEAPRGFEVAGEDLKFYSATAAVSGTSVTLRASEVKSPVYVRYAWADRPPVNLLNRYQLPALPFRTDTVAK